MFKPIEDMARRMLKLGRVEPIPPRYVEAIDRAEAFMFCVCRRVMEFRTSELAILLASVPEPPEMPEKTEPKPDPPKKRGPGRPKKVREPVEV